MVRQLQKSNIALAIAATLPSNFDLPLSLDLAAVFFQRRFQSAQAWNIHASIGRFFIHRLGFERWSRLSLRHVGFWDFH